MKGKGLIRKATLMGLSDRGLKRISESGQVILTDYNYIADIFLYYDDGKYFEVTTKEELFPMKKERLKMGKITNWLDGPLLVYRPREIDVKEGDAIRLVVYRNSDLYKEIDRSEYVTNYNLAKEAYESNNREESIDKSKVLVKK